MLAYEIPASGCKTSLARLALFGFRHGAEHRELIIGHSIERRLIVVCFTTRETRIRLFTARKATRIERKDYEENVGS